MTPFADWDEAMAALAELNGETEPAPYSLCGTLLASGEPRYFILPAETTTAEVRETAFQIREGRPMSSYERWALAAAERFHEDPVA
jgi:hypothetical protein